ncbi:hypothetical protein [Nonomuraea aridisoli]|uniref:Uncharacterized protein n=1 Tax=Nonomuraea aridisoli TaxID=2070368 RepID=A0A2W2E6M5_9ACTN|nr:hypothetical protein [Nonomuraea aridisoli]PZG19762.1 hypothetical protein C1J01_11115 [Nonomuraea aridisoli]
MRARWSAAFLLVLSWFLPVGAQAQVVPQVVRQVSTAQAGPQTVVRPTPQTAGAPDAPRQQAHSGVRQVPHQAPDARAWAGAYGLAGPAAAGVLGGGVAGYRAPWAVVVPAAAGEGPTVRAPSAAAARAPPSTGF